MFKYSPMTFFLQIKIRLVKWNYYVMIQVFVLYENMLAKWQKMKNGKINNKMENITSEWFFLRWLQHDISMVLINKKTICFTHNIVRRWVQSPNWKNRAPPKEPIPTWNDITYVSAKLSDPPKIKFPVHSHLEYILQKVFKMTGVKLTIWRLSPIGIYW